MIAGVLMEISMGLLFFSARFWIKEIGISENLFGKFRFGCVITE
jgi:hypothetical protein